MTKKDPARGGMPWRGESGRATETVNTQSHTNPLLPSAMLCRYPLRLELVQLERACQWQHPRNDAVRPQCGETYNDLHE